MNRLRVLGRMARRSRAGFTLIDTAMATILVGVGVASLMSAIAASTRVNNEAKRLTTASFLLQEVREMTADLPFEDPDEDEIWGPEEVAPANYDDLIDYLQIEFSPPVAADGTVLNQLTRWSQSIRVISVDENNVRIATAPGSTGMVRLEATISLNGVTVAEGKWLITGDPE